MSVHPLVTALMMRRLRLGKTQRAVARAAKLSPATVCEVESGKVGPRLANFVRLADALDCDVVLVPRRQQSETRTEYAWAPSPDAIPRIHSAMVARDLVADLGGAVYVREVTDWRPETTQEQS